MPNQYKLGDKVFNSTGDIKKDIELIKQNFPEVDTTALEKGLGGETNSNTNVGQDTAAPSAKPTVTYPEEVTRYKTMRDQFQPGTEPWKRWNAGYEAGKKDFEDTNPWIKEVGKAPKEATPPKFSDKDIETISALKNTQEQLKKVLELKNSGFGGQGIDTGPLAGRVPASFSEFFNKHVEGMGEHSSDRGLLRQEILKVLNPERKAVTGSSAAESEIRRFIEPSVPGEKDNDQTFFKKGFESLSSSQSQMLNLLTTMKQAGIDVSKFEKEMSTKPEDLVTEIQRQLAQNQAGSFSKEFPDTAKTFLGGMLQKNQPSGGMDLKAMAAEERRRRMGQ